MQSEAPVYSTASPEIFDSSAYARLGTGAAAAFGHFLARRLYRLFGVVPTAPLETELIEGELKRKKAPRGLR